MTARVAALSLALLLGQAAAAHAQQAELEQVLGRLGISWAGGDAAAIAILGARAGLSLELDGERVGPLTPRQAAAVLRRLFEDRETLRLQPGRAQVVGGTPLRAFGELAWEMRAYGTTIPERTTIFLALVREEDGWRITQIRLLP